MAKISYVHVESALGMALSHDMTQIDVKTGYKGARFKKGHILRQEDVRLLKSMGKESISVLELDEGDVHEDDAASRLAERLSGEGISSEAPEEGKVALSALWNGLLVYDEESIHRINEDPDWIVATAANKVPVKKGELVAGVRIVPLVMREEQVRQGEDAVLPLTVFPFVPLKTALVTTGKELAEGRIRDGFAPKLQKKLAGYGATLQWQTVVGDEREEIAAAITAYIEQGAELVIATGGMSVDPDDRTAGAIASVAEEVRFKGVPTVPGAHLMLALRGEAKIVGAPACVVHDEWTSLDPLLNRLFAGLIPTAAEVRRWGVGGMCRKCRECNYPVCVFAAR
ncbi:molybdopterin-binding protein [Aminivibrio sp.]|jgi:hypothetical protein|uniref:molybdopterin-binding protein n=1 Tax=Aminivibrio sp. TaxID=1872489 RepID=UPI001A4AD87C|nr:molybdopterin-binding protein [Aminivibrio sp.]MBL3540220.1 molybdopterin-binding protein [Aminivibrio sp.]